MSNRKIVATIGPASASVQQIRELRNAGMDIARLNGSHASFEWHSSTIRMIREAAPEVPILLDIPGRKIRTIQLKHEPAFERGETIVLTTDLAHDGTQKVPVNYALLHEDLKEGDSILADDGQLRFLVKSIHGADIFCEAQASGKLRSAKGINVPAVSLRTALVTERDSAALAFAREHGVDFVGISFVESAAHIRAVRDAIGGRFPAVIAKVENKGGLEHVEEIVASADAIMIDRGDLSVETSLESVTLYQKRILGAARRASCPVIVATEMLHSMMDSPNPTKAEVSDITNAVLDGASAVMLSGETAVGDFALESVVVMRSVAAAAAQFAVNTDRPASATIPEAMGDAIGLLCSRAPITKIVAVTMSGFAARMVASQFPAQPIIAVSNNVNSARAFNLLPGVTGVAVDIAFSRTSTDHIPQCLEALWRSGHVGESDMVLVVGLAYPKSGNRMNIIQLHRVDDMRATLQWVR